MLDGKSFDGVWCSDLRRAATTARLAWEGEARSDSRLREMSFGTLEGLPREMLDPRWQEVWCASRASSRQGARRSTTCAAACSTSWARSAPAATSCSLTGASCGSLTREVGEDHFVPTGSLLVVDWESRRIVFRRDGEGRPSRGLPSPAEEQEG